MCSATPASDAPLPHPVAGTGPDKLRHVARDAAPRLVAALRGGGT